MKIIIIVAMTPEGLIGKDGGLPWHEPADLAHFKRTTTGHAVIMGRKTFDSIGRPLPKRRNIVLTRDAALAKRLREQHGSVKANLPTAKDDSSKKSAGVSATPDANMAIDTADSLEAALELCRRRGEAIAFVVGGAQIFAAALPLADEMIVTWIKQANLTGDTYFPSWDASSWKATPVENKSNLDIVHYH